MIALLDANNFFVSCERLFRPDLVGKPVAVLSSNDGCIVARSNEVKALGVPMGMPLFQAKQLVDMSGVTLFSSNFTLYRDLSRRVMEVLAAEVGECEQYSIDESFFALASNITYDEVVVLRAHIMQATGIPVSIGAATTKTLAKVASEMGKQGSGVTILTDAKWQATASTYTASEVWNLGHATAQKLKQAGVTTTKQFMDTDRQWIAKQFGVAGCRLFDELHGRLVYPLVCNSTTLRQSIASTRSFATTTQRVSDLESAVAYHITQVAQKLRRQHLLATRIYIEARASRHSDFGLRKSGMVITLEQPSNDTSYLLKAGLKALRSFYDPAVPYKKAGVTVSGLVPKSFAQADLFSAKTETLLTSPTTLDTITDTLNQRFGAGSIRSGIITQAGARASAKLRSQHYTTDWKDIATVKTK